MSLTQRITSDRQLSRLLQIGVVLEEVVEVRAYQHYNTLSASDRAEMDPAISELLEEAAEESAEHRQRLAALIEALNDETVSFEAVEAMVREQYGQTKPEDFDGILYDQLNGEETAYKFYDDLITAVEESDATFSVDRTELLAELRAIRDEEEEGVREVTTIMEDRA